LDARGRDLRDSGDRRLFRICAGRSLKQLAHHAIGVSWLANSDRLASVH
jgi:hypothetical protein